jgi:hypothetical protein
MPSISTNVLGNRTLVLQRVIRLSFHFQPNAAHFQTQAITVTVDGGDTVVTMDSKVRRPADQSPSAHLSVAEPHCTQQLGLVVLAKKTYTGQMILSGTHAVQPALRAKRNFFGRHLHPSPISQHLQKGKTPCDSYTCSYPSTSVVSLRHSRDRRCRACDTARL